MSHEEWGKWESAHSTLRMGLGSGLHSHEVKNKKLEHAQPRGNFGDLVLCLAIFVPSLTFAFPNPLKLIMSGMSQ